MNLYNLVFIMINKLYFTIFLILNLIVSLLIDNIKYFGGKGDDQKKYNLDL